MPTRHHQHPSSSPSASPEAKLFFYRGPTRPIPSPENILSIDRRDEDEERDSTAHGGPRDSYAAQRPLRRPTANGRSDGSGAPSPKIDVSDHTDDFFFFDPEWTQEAGRTHTDPLSTPLARVGTHHHRRTPRRQQHHHEAPTDVPASVLSSSVHSEGNEPTKAAGHGTKQHETPREKELRRLLRRHQRHIEAVLEPQLAQTKRELQEKKVECQQLHADNVVLAAQLQRQQQQTTAATTAKSPVPSSVRSGDHTFLAAAPFAMPPPVPVPHEMDSSDDMGNRLRESAAEVVLLRRQLATLQSRCETPAQRTRFGKVTSPLLPSVSPSPSTTSSATEVLQRFEAQSAALVGTCRAIAEDSLGFTEALTDMHDRLATERGTNPFRAAADAWRSFSHMTAAAGSVDAAMDVSAGWRLLLQSLVHTVQTEHGAVATGMEALQQAERATVESVARHQAVVAQVRHETERRMEEMEADHEAEVATLENAIAELEQQVSATAASRRPWTAGLFIQHGQDSGGGAGVGSPTSGGERGNGRRRDSVARTGGTADSFDGMRRHEAHGAGGALPLVRAEADTQTPLSLEWIQACLQKAREEPMRAVRREKEAELVELMSTEVEGLRRQLTDSRAVATRLREAQRRFLGDVTLPLSYFDNFSSFPAYV